MKGRKEIWFTQITKCVCFQRYGLSILKIKNLHQFKLPGIFYLTLCMWFFGMSGLYAQHAVIAAGGNANGNGGNTSYTIGQVFYSSGASSSHLISEGVQQAYEISVVTGSNEAHWVKLEILAHPNPTSGDLTLNIDVADLSDLQSLHYMIYDMTGKLIESNKVEAKSNSISLKNLAPAAYFLKVTNSNKELKTFKIIKI